MELNGPNECNEQRNGFDNSTERITQWNSMDTNVHGLALPLVPNQTHLAHDMNESFASPTSFNSNMVGSDRLGQAHLRQL